VTHRGILLHRIYPVAVPDIFLVAEATASAIDRCHSLTSLNLPPAALGSLPVGDSFAFLPLAKTAEHNSQREL